MSWNVSGSYYESCNCEAACPCVFLSPPTTGECTVLVGWHIDEGNYEGTSLDGLNVALAVQVPGHMMEVKWNAAVYLDDSASEAQAGALGAIFSGAAGGHPAALASHIGQVLGVTSAPISFDIDGLSRSMKIGDLADVSLTAIGGQGGTAVTVTNHPLCISPGNSAVVAKSDHLKYTDHGMEWDLTEKNGFFSPFAYSGS